MKTNADIARIAFRYCGGFAALFIILNNRAKAKRKK